MQISRLSETQFKNAYGILCSSIGGQSLRDGVSPTFCSIPYKQATTEHAHFESEIFFIISGTGRITIDGQTANIGTGDLIRIPQFTRHTLANTGSENLIFLSVYSEDFEVPHAAASTLVTAAPPTPNGPLHLGHMSGPYLAADIVTRQLKRRADAVMAHSGTDDHQNYVSEKALSLSREAEDFRREMRARIQTGLSRLSITFDQFIEPKTDSTYQQKAQEFVRRALGSGVIRPEIIELPHCSTCDTFLIDARIDGSCPACEEPSRGGCESCGVVVPPQDLLQPKCTRCGQHAERKATGVHTFAISEYLPLIADDLERLQLSPRLRNFVDRVLRIKNLKVLVAHPESSGHGIPMPEGDQVLHVWFEMAAHYEQFSLSEQEWIHCFGFDNSFYYILFIPSLLRAMDPRAKLPETMIVNEFLLLEGRKFSTSQGHAIWADEFKGDTDFLRLYLCVQRPETATADFTVEGFQRFSFELEDAFQSMHKLIQTPDSLLPTPASNVDSSRFEREMDLFLSPKTFDLRRAARRILEFIDLIVQNRDTGNEQRLHALAHAIAPIMPNRSRQLFNDLKKK